MPSSTALSGGPVVFFDGQCHLCARSVQFIIRRDRAGKFRFASLQSEAGKTAIQAATTAGNPPPDSLILWEDGQYYTAAAAALRIASQLDGGWKLLAGFRILPRFLRENLYRLVARHRYKWFGKRETCWLPRPEWRERFID